LSDNISDDTLLGVKETFKDVARDASYTDRALDKACVGASKDLYNDKVFPYTFAGRNLGNSYAGSLYFGLLSLIAESDKTNFNNERVMMFSYGSGLAATMFSLQVDGSLENQRQVCNLKERLEDRIEATPEEFTAALKEREDFYTASDFQFSQPSEKMMPGAFHLTGVDNMGCRSYDRVPAAMAASARGYHTAAPSKRAFAGQNSTLANARAPFMALRRVLRR